MAVMDCMYPQVHCTPMPENVPCTRIGPKHEIAQTIVLLRALRQAAAIAASPAKTTGARARSDKRRLEDRGSELRAQIAAARAENERLRAMQSGEHMHAHGGGEER